MTSIASYTELRLPRHPGASDAVAAIGGELRPATHPPRWSSLQGWCGGVIAENVVAKSFPRLRVAQCRLGRLLPSAG